MISVSSSATINIVDAPTGATLNELNVDLRGAQGAGGFITADVAATGVSAGSVAIPATINTVDAIGGGKTSTVNVDLRQNANAGGFFEVEVLTANITAAAATPGAAPTTGQTVSGALGARTEYFKYTYVDANGNETLASAEATQAISANNVATVTSPGASTGATKYNVYGSSTSGAETLQNASPIALGTNWQEPNTGLTSTGRTAPSNATLVAGACTVTIAAGPPLAAGAATLTISQ